MFKWLSVLQMKTIVLASGSGSRLWPLSANISL